MSTLNEHIFLTKFNINDESYYAKINCTHSETDLLTIEILGQSQSWSGKLSHNAAKSFCENLDETEEEYFTNILAALKKKEQSYIVDFILDKNDANLYKFVWKRKIPKGFLIHGFVMLQKNVDTVTKDTIMDYLINKNEILECTIEVRNKEIDSLKNELLKYKREFENLIDIKNTIEDNLYGKFIQILNAKKKRIRLLEDELNSIEAANRFDDDG